MRVGGITIEQGGLGGSQQKSLLDLFRVFRLFIGLQDFGCDLADFVVALLSVGRFVIGLCTTCDNAHCDEEQDGENPHGS